MGAFHAESIARRVPGAVLAAVADPNVESAEALARSLGTAKVTPNAEDILAGSLLVRTPPPSRPASPGSTQ